MFSKINDQQYLEQTIGTIITDLNDYDRHADAVNFIELVRYRGEEAIPTALIQDVACIIKEKMSASLGAFDAWGYHKYDLIDAVIRSGRVSRSEDFTTAESDLIWQRLTRSEPSPSRRATYLTNIVIDPKNSPSIAIDAASELAQTLSRNLGTSPYTRYQQIPHPVLERAFQAVKVVFGPSKKNLAKFADRPEPVRILGTIGALYKWDGTGSAPNLPSLPYLKGGSWECDGLHILNRRQIAADKRPGL